MSDDELIEAIARAMFKDDQINRLDIAQAALDTCRPIIEAPLRAENAKLKSEIARLRAALKNWDALIRHHYTGSRAAMYDMSKCVQETARLLS